MMMLLSPSGPATRQALISGRIREAVTGRAVDGCTIQATYAQGPRTGVFTATTATKPGGWFVLHADPSRDVPDFSGGGDVTLTVRIDCPDRTPAEASLVRPEADLLVVDRTVTINGTAQSILAVSGAPFEISPLLALPPVALEGTLIRDFDPESPASGVTVTAAPAAPVISDAAGRFFIPALPPAETVTLALEDGASLVDHSFRPDYSRRKNTLTLSLPIASP